MELRGVFFDFGCIVDVLFGVVLIGLSFGFDGVLYVNDWLDGYVKKL